MQRAVVLALSAALGAVGVFTPIHDATQQTAATAPADAQDRTRLLELQRAAVAQLQQARRDGAPADQVRRALVDASRSLEALGAEPESSTAAGTPAKTALAPSLRVELRRAASALLEKVRTQLEGVALGLTFEGSYSQTKPKEPATGGHASAMGPAPANNPSPEDNAPVPVTFEEGARLPTKIYCGG